MFPAKFKLSMSRIY